jgi:GTPase SAR1 family protein
MGEKNIVFVGYEQSGKTSLFNSLTGNSKQEGIGFEKTTIGCNVGEVKILNVKLKLFDPEGMKHKLTRWAKAIPPIKYHLIVFFFRSISFDDNPDMFDILMYAEEQKFNYLILTWDDEHDHKLETADVKVHFKYHYIKKGRSGHPNSLATIKSQIINKLSDEPFDFMNFQEILNQNKDLRQQLSDSKQLMEIKNSTIKSLQKESIDDNGVGILGSAVGVIPGVGQVVNGVELVFHGYKFFKQDPEIIKTRLKEMPIIKWFF